MTNAIDVTWEQLMQGEGWTPARIYALRNLVGPYDGVPMPREEFAKHIHATERSLYRWEHGKTRPGAAHCDAMARYADSLDGAGPGIREALA